MKNLITIKNMKTYFLTKNTLKKNQSLRFLIKAWYLIKVLTKRKRNLMTLGVKLKNERKKTTE